MSGNGVESQAMYDMIVSLSLDMRELKCSVVGHGILITELDERVRRIERRLDMTPAA